MSDESDDSKEPKVVVYSRYSHMAHFIKGCGGEVPPHAKFINMDALAVCLNERAEGLPFATFVDLDTDTLEGVAPCDLAVRIAKENPDSKLVLFSWLPLCQFWLDNGFRQAMSYRNTEYVRMPVTMPEVISVCQRTRVDNPAFRASANLHQGNVVIERLKHDWKYEDRRENILNVARERLGWEGSDSDIEQKIIAYAPSTVVEPAYFPGVFCDVEGTILNEGKLDDLLVKELDSMSTATPVTLWTGADLKDYSYLVSKLGYPLLSKHWFRGSTVEQAIDDDPKELFEANYGIMAKNYRKV